MKQKMQTNRKAQRTPTVACCIAEGSFTIHGIISWITLHQAVNFPASKAPHTIIGVCFNFVRSTVWVAYSRKQMRCRETDCTRMMYRNPRKNPVSRWLRGRMRMVWGHRFFMCLWFSFLTRTLVGMIISHIINHKENGNTKAVREMIFEIA